jgi:hypothetical protein
VRSILLKSSIKVESDLILVAAQIEWIRETIEEAHALAKRSNLDLSIEIYVTRATDTSEGSSGSSTPCDSPSLASMDDEKREVFGHSLGSSFIDARQFAGRPDIAASISKVVSESTGNSLVIGE